MLRCKSRLCYHGKPQVAYAFELLGKYCDRVFVSSRKDQAHSYAQFPQIHDMYTNFGPVCGILSAMERFPDVAWLTLANDLPYVDAQALDLLVRHRAPQYAVIAYDNAAEMIPEPLCTIYEPVMRLNILQFFHTGGPVLRKAMEVACVKLLTPPHALTLMNINTQEEYERVMQS